MTRSEYNGWANYETWNCALWMDNDGAVEIFTERAHELSECEDMEQNDRIDTLAMEIKDFVEENNPLADSATMYSDLLGSALQEIDWYEIASHYYEE